MKKKGLKLLTVSVLLVSLLLGTVPTALAADTDEDTVHKKVFGKNDNRNVFTETANYNHSNDAAILEAYLTGETDMMDDRYGLYKEAYERRTRYVQYVHPEVIGLYYVTRWVKAGTDITSRYEAIYLKEQPSSAGNFALPENYFTKAELQAVQEEFQNRLPQVVAEVKALLPENPTEFEKVHVAHDYLVATTVYDNENKNSNYLYFDYDASGPFVQHKSMCQGYSLAFKYLMDQLGVECGVAVSGQAGHAWNVVKIDGQWYHVDTSGDDMNWDMLGRVDHTYLCLSTDTLLSMSASRSDFIVYLDDYNTVFTDATCCTSKQYESGQIWNDTMGCCHYYKGHLYTLGANNELCKDGEEYFLPTGEHMQWHPFGNEFSRFSETRNGKMTAIGNTVYYLSPKKIYAINLDTEEKKVFYVPDTADTDTTWGMQIFGLAMVEGSLCYTLNNNYPTANEIWLQANGAKISCSVRLGRDISVCAFGALDTVTGDNIQMRFTRNGTSETVSGEENGGRYEFTYRRIPPQTMNDIIQMELVCDGIIVCSKYFSPRKYITKLLGTEFTDDNTDGLDDRFGYTQEKTEALHVLLRDVLTYGGAAQSYAGYETDALVSENIEGSSYPLPTDTALEISGSKAERFTEATVNFDAVNNLVFTFRTENTDSLEVRFRRQGEDSYQILPYETTGENTYRVYSPSIYGTDFDTVYVAELFDTGARKTVSTVSFSVNSYVFAMQNHENSALASLVKALYNYGVSSKAFLE